MNNSRITDFFNYATSNEGLAVACSVAGAINALAGNFILAAPFSVAAAHFYFKDDPSPNPPNLK